MVRTPDELDALLDNDPFLEMYEVGVLMRVDTKTAGRWAKAGRFPDRPDGVPGVIKTPGGGWRVRESIVRGLLDGSLTAREVPGGRG